MNHENQIAKGSVYHVNALASEVESAYQIGKKLERYYMAVRGDDSIFKTIIPSYSDRHGRKVVALCGNIEDISIFNHPIYNNGVEFIDARSMVDLRTNQIKDQDSYDTLIRRAILDMLWIENRGVFVNNNLIDLMAKTFSDWVGDRLSNGLNLNIRTTAYAKVFLIAHILAMSINQELTNDEIAGIIIKRCPRILHVSDQVVHEILNMYPTAFEELFHEEYKSFYLAKALNILTDGEPLINIKVIYECIGAGATMLPNSRILSYIAIDNIPTFLALLNSVNRMSMKTTKLGNALYHASRNYGNTLQDFINLHTSYETQ